MPATDRLFIRVAPELKAKIEAAAAKDGRSVSNYVLHVLEEKIKEEQKGMTIADIKEMFSGGYADIEVYRFRSRRHSIHTDNIESVDDYSDSDSVAEWQLMDEEDYYRTVLANASATADFEEWYGDAEAKVLVIVLPEE